MCAIKVSQKAQAVCVSAAYQPNYGYNDCPQIR
jgi:hypothetical protein